MNRTVSDFNEKVDGIVLKPVATIYRTFVPPLVRTGVANFFSNLTDVWSGANSLLQLNVPHAAESFLRFGVNTFFGLGGILDVASEANIERHREDFGQTLGRWGIPPGPYVVLPLLGPSTLRDALSLPADRHGNMLHRFDEDWRFGLYTLRTIDARANLLRVTSVLDEAALDKYSFTRDAHLQRRRAEIFEKKADDPGAGSTSDGAEPPLEPADAASGNVRQPASAPAR